jgi:hypothetical protein
LFRDDRTPVEGKKVDRIVSKNIADNRKMLEQVGSNSNEVQ